MFSYLLCLIGNYILWNSERVTLRYLGNTLRNTTTKYGDQTLTNNSVVWDDVYFAKNIMPRYLSFPILGTRDIDTGDVNFLYLPRNTTVYMFKKDSWKGVSINGWTYTGDEGNFLGPKVGKIKIYKKEYSPGRYKINNKSAMYLFNSKGITFT